MATLPHVLALQGGTHESEFPDTDLPKTITLSGSSTLGDGASITTWEWSILRTDADNKGSIPATSTIDTGTVDDFTNGKSSLQNPQITLDVVGGYCFSLRVQNNIGQWSDPSYLVDGQSAQAIVYILTVEPFAMRIPPALMYRPANSLGNTLRSMTQWSQGINQYLFYQNDDPYVETSLTYVTQLSFRHVIPTGNVPDHWNIQIGLWQTGGGTCDFRLSFDGTDVDISETASSETENFDSTLVFAGPTLDTILTCDLKLKRTGGTDARFQFLRIYEEY